MSKETLYRELELEAKRLWQNALIRAQCNGKAETPDFDSLMLATLPECNAMLNMYNKVTGREESDLPDDAVEQVRQALSAELRRYNLKVTVKTIRRLGTQLRLEPAA